MLLPPHPFAELLRTGDTVTALARAQAWLPTASYGDIARLVEACPARLRQHLVALFRDVLTGYPEVLYGCPVAFRWEPVERGGDLVLPAQDLSWLSLSVLHDGPFKPQPGELVSIQGYAQECAVLLLPAALLTAPPEPGDEWWLEVFAEVLRTDKLFVATSRVLPWPDAAEAACRLLASANGAHAAETPQLFVGDACLAAAEAGRQFRARMQAREDV